MQVRTRCRVVEIDAEGVTFEEEGQRHRLPTRTVVWAAGVAASPWAEPWTCP